MFPRTHFTSSHCPHRSVNDFNLPMLCTLDKPCADSGSAAERQEEANGRIGAKRGVFSFLKRNIHTNIKGVTISDTDKLQMRFH